MQTHFLRHRARHDLRKTGVCVAVAVALEMGAGWFGSAAVGWAQQPSVSPSPAAATPKPAPEYAFEVDADRPDALYHVGETVTFHVRMLHGGQPAGDEEVSWTISKDGVPPQETGKARLAHGEATLTGKLDEPGFLHCEVQFKRDKETFTGVGGAGIDPLQIRPSMASPDDFDAFWEAKLKELAAVPINARLTSVPPPPTRKGAEAFDVQADCVGGMPMSGYYGRPVGAAPHSLPAMLIVHGAGVDGANLDQVCGWAGSGYLTLDINAHGLPNGKPREFYGDLANGDLKDYRTRGAASRDTFYFLGMFLRAKRAMDFLTAQPEWDGRTLVANGGSQGGAQSIAVAGLDGRVTYVIAIVPAMGDHTGAMVGRVAGWPKLVTKGPDGRPDPAILNASRYFDTVNFAARIKARAFVSVGFIDVICPPTTVYAMYNRLQGRKEMYNDIHGGHGGDPRPGAPNIWGEVRKRLLEYAAEVKKTP